MFPSQAVRLLRGGFRESTGLPINTTRASGWPEVEIAQLGYDACADAEGVELDGRVWSGPDRNRV